MSESKINGKALTYEILKEAVEGNAAAIRCRSKLQPAAGEGTKVYPPTYAGAIYAMEKRRVPNHDQPVDCVLLDSVQSQANRMEEALQQSIDSGRLNKAKVSIPLIEVDFNSFWDPQGISVPKGEMRLLEPVGTVSSLQAPHRIADAILRDSLVAKADDRGNETEKNRPFRSKSEKAESSFGRELRRVSAQNATPLFQLCPTALLFGMWDSTGPKGGLGAKFERAIVSEVVGINAVSGVRSSSRIDPLGIQLDAGPLYVASDNQDGSWTLDPNLAKQEGNSPVKVGKDGKPSEANHGNIKPDIKDKKGQPFHGGVTISFAERSVVLSFPALRRLQFPIKGEPKSDPTADNAARTVLAALGLCAATLAAEMGLDLRSRCALWSTEPLVWDLLGKPGEKQEGLTLDADGAIELLKKTVDVAKSLGLPWREEPLVLIPSDDLVKLVVKSQQLALQQGGEGGE